MEEKPWRANMKKKAATTNGAEGGEKKEEEEEEEKRPRSEKEDEEDELLKRPWRNNMRETARKSAEGKHSKHAKSIPPTNCFQQPLL